jgi:predicted restriction endonuclease
MAKRENKIIWKSEIRKLKDLNERLFFGLMVLMTLVACIITKVYSQISEQGKRRIRKEIRRKGILETIPSEIRMSLLEGWAKWFMTDLLNLKRKALIEWREKILKKYNYTCLKCKTKENLEVHHVYNVKDYPELMGNLKNGIVLCKKCHKEFHKIYGKRKNNPEQILEFLGVKTKNCDSNVIYGKSENSKTI